MTELYAFYEHTIHLIGRTGWDKPPAEANARGIIPEECSLADGSRGLRYTDWLYGPAEEAPATAATRVAAIWRKQGFTATVVPPQVPEDPLFRARGSRDGMRAVYWATPDSTSIAIVMPCIPGDYIALTDGVIEHRASQTPPVEP